MICKYCRVEEGQLHEMGCAFEVCPLGFFPLRDCKCRECREPRYRLTERKEHNEAERIRRQEELAKQGRRRPYKQNPVLNVG